jgi:glycosyltransferase involved in cell wall biosynthesis
MIGYFGYGPGIPDGQTSKTKNIRNLIDKYGTDVEPVRYYDTADFRRNPLTLFQIITGAIWSDYVIIMPSGNNMTYIFPVVYVLSLLFRFEIIHVAIGSKQSDFLRNKKWFRRSYIKMQKSIKAFLLEVGCVEKELQEEFGFRNTGISRNFRVSDYIPNITNKNNGLRIVFMSRVTPKKGTDVVFNIGEYIDSKYPNGDVTIDIYGPIADEVKFEERIAAAKRVNYKGVLAPEEIPTTLNQYDLLLLPTRRYYSEGFPGAILDAYISGIPVLVSKWAYAHEFVSDGVTGFIHDVEDTESFCHTIDTLYNDKELLLKLKHSAWEESKKYNEDVAWKEIEKYLS